MATDVWAKARIATSESPAAAGDDAYRPDPLSPSRASSISGYQESRLPVQRGDRTVFVNERDIVAAAAAHGYSYIHLNTERVLVNYSLTELEQRLSNAFFRVHRSYLANLNRLVELRPDFKGGAGGGDGRRGPNPDPGLPPSGSGVAAPVGHVIPVHVAVGDVALVQLIDIARQVPEVRLDDLVKPDPQRPQRRVGDVTIAEPDQQAKHESDRIGRREILARLTILHKRGIGHVAVRVER
ncbi:MAG: LytTR family transcriptional regulator [Acidimicrobiia bacterium]|nr:LytTR family transcriptional regulator [Acidimicrobiia bacterium]MDH5520463.1 LytTR family transcriptional regulator [Acidimicrobiia bacterium]